MTSTYATGGTITTYPLTATTGIITYFHTFNITGFSGNEEINKKFTATSAITNLNYVLVGGGYRGTDSSGGAGGNYLIGVISSFPSAGVITITNIADVTTTNPPGNTTMSYGVVNYTTETGEAGAPAGTLDDGVGGHNILNYRSGITNGGYISSSGGNGNATDTGGSGGLGNDGNGGGDTEAGVSSTQFGGGGGGAGANNSTVGSGGPGAVIIYYTTGMAPICFLAGTPVLTDQGEVTIENINPNVNTINHKKIIAITKTAGTKNCLVLLKKNLISNNVPSRDTYITVWHKVYHDNRMRESKRIPGAIRYPYNGEILYNVLMHDHEKMKVNGLIVETLLPDHNVAKYYRSLMN